MIQYLWIYFGYTFAPEIFNAIQLLNICNALQITAHDFLKILSWCGIDAMYLLNSPAWKGHRTAKKDKMEQPLTPAVRTPNSSVRAQNLLMSFKKGEAALVNGPIFKYLVRRHVNLILETQNTNSWPCRTLQTARARAQIWPISQPHTLEPWIRSPAPTPKASKRTKSFQTAKKEADKLTRYCFALDRNPTLIVNLNGIRGHQFRHRPILSEKREMGTKI